MSDPQLRLLKVQNPLKICFSGEFFKQIPESPGVYWMLGARQQVLYVGKAKNLRARLRNYRNGAFERLPNKTQKLLKHVCEIHWDIAPDETTALLRENELLRTLKPPFNVVNTRPETYLYFGIRALDIGLEIQLMFHLHEAPKDLKIYGAFKGLPRAMKTHASILRWTWAQLHQACNWPLVLMKKTAPKRFVIPWSGDSIRDQFLLNSLTLYFTARQSLLEFVLPEEDPAPFIQSIWLGDQIQIASFYQRSICRLQDLKNSFKLDEQIVPQHRIDDLQVLRSMRAFAYQLSERQTVQHAFLDEGVKG